MAEQFPGGPFYLYKNNQLLPQEFETYSAAILVLNALCFGGDENPFMGSITSISIDNKFYFNKDCYVIRRKL